MREVGYICYYQPMEKSWIQGKENSSRTKPDALHQILIFNLAGFRIAMETHIWVFSERFYWRGKTHPNVGGTNSWTRSWGGVKVRMFTEHQHVLLCFLMVVCAQCDQLPHLPVSMDSPSWWHGTLTLWHKVNLPSLNCFPCFSFIITTKKVMHYSKEYWVICGIAILHTLPTRPSKHHRKGRGKAVRARGQGRLT